MSIFDVDKADEKIDYEVIYKKRFDEIENRLKCITMRSADLETINQLHNDINWLRNEVFRHNEILYNIRDNMNVLRIMLNQLLPENQQIFFTDIF